MIVETLTKEGQGRTADGTLIPRTLPGEEVEQTETGTRILTPSPNRVAAPCRHFKTCGGCAVQHMSDAAVAEWKQDVVRTALRNQGLPEDLAGIETSPANSRRRAKLTGRRTKKSAAVGFLRAGSDMLVEVPDCQLLSPALIAGFPAAQALTAMVCSRKGEVALTLTETLSGLDVLLTADRALDGPLRLDLAQVAQDHGLARLTYGDEVIAQRHPPALAFGRARVVPPPGAFLQATQHGEQALIRAVRTAIGPAKRVADLFSGCGTFSLPIAEGAEVHAVESDAAMLTALDTGWRNAQALKRITTERRDLFRRPLEVDELAKFDAVVIDPPRAGAEAQTTALATAKRPVIAMVSCNPASFARDARVLTQAGYTMDPPQVIDQFRWSAHVELVTRFTIC